MNTARPNSNARSRNCATRSATARLAFAAVAVAGFTGTAALLLPQRARAQAPCTEIVNDTERLACYDRALRPARPAVPTAPATAPARAAVPLPAPTPTPAAQAPSREIGTERPSEPRTARAARSPAAAAAAAPPAPAAPASAGNTDEKDEFVPIVVVNVRGLPGRNDKAFTTDGGVIWLQTDNERMQVPDPPFDAQIKPGMMGSFFLVVEGRHRAVRVRRQN